MSAIPIRPARMRGTVISPFTVRALNGYVYRLDQPLPVGMRIVFDVEFGSPRCVAARVRVRTG